MALNSIIPENRVVAAPMAGITDKAFRIIAASYGCGLTFTEMISDQALIHGHHRTWEMLDLKDDQAPVAVQIFGSNPENMRKAALIVEESGARILDINMGCPTPKIVKNGEGAALMQDLNKACEVIKAVVRTVKIPVTLKMRTGWNDASLSYLELAQIAQNEGVSAITLHPRTREQFFSGRSDWEAINRLKKTIRIPVIGNGDIFSAADARAMIEATGCDAVMIGRGALGNPFIFQQTSAYLKGEELPPEPTPEQRFDTALKHFDLVVKFKGQDKALKEMRKHFAWYIKGFSGAASARAAINQAISREDLVQILEQVFLRTDLSTTGN
ncbi:MAG: tRNA dihydrouridine synthase DusB [Chitinophagales bacterium]